MNKTFHMGGIHPEKFKLTTDEAIVDAGLPEIAYIPIKQHIGAPAKILVKPGDKVKVGTLLADSDGVVSSDVHSSVSGEVLKVETVEAAQGWQEAMVTVKVIGDEFEPGINRTSDIVANIPESAAVIARKIRDGGIVGMGGAGYPTPVKTTIPEGKKAKKLILNGIECEPYLTADDRLMVEKAEEIVIGARIINKLLGIKSAVIAIDENKPRAIEEMTKVCKRYVGVNVQVLKTKYPQGAEKQLIEAVIGREVPAGKLPIDIGCVVQNVGTVYAIYEMVMKNKPLYERIVTVSGDNLEKRGNFRVRVGTPASYLIDKAVGGNKENIGKVIFGGPMMGLSVTNMSAPVTKLTSGILVLSEEKSFKPQETNCIRCAKCGETCPMGLQPFAIAESIRKNDYDRLWELQVMSCIECACCAYICPAKLPLLDYLKLAKFELRNRKAK